MPLTLPVCQNYRGSLGGSLSAGVFNNRCRQATCAPATERKRALEAGGGFAYVAVAV